MYFADRILHFLGAKIVRIPEKAKDPESEDDFLQLDYESDVRYTWIQYIESREIVKQNHGLSLLRLYRNKNLADSDWIMTLDNVERISNIQEWKDYRQSLRDLPQQTIEFIWKDNGLDFINMNLPIKPIMQFNTIS